ncbi:MAG: type 1 glutamine amidotransferase [bacterium]
MRIHCLQHVPYEKPGVISHWAESNNHVLTMTKSFREVEFPDVTDVDLLVVLGGPMGANDEVDYPWISDEKRFIEQCMESSTVVLGICLGAQMIANVLGADVYKARYSEVGWHPIELTEQGKDHDLVDTWSEELDVFHWHGDTFDLPDGATRLAESPGCDNQAFVYDETVVGLQFHVELTADDIEYMLEFTGNDIPRGPYCQTKDEILQNLEHANKLNTLALEFLENLPVGKSSDVKA